MNLSTGEELNTAEQLQNEVFARNVQALHPQSRETLMSEISAMEKDKNANEKAKQYLKWILKQTEFNFYLALLPKGRGLVLLKQDLKAVLVIGFNQPHEDWKHLFEGHEFILEILNIHSLEKGEGNKLMKKVIDLSKKLDSPICLWTETAENVQYFERYGFKKYSETENSSNCMMIFKNN